MKVFHNSFNEELAYGNKPKNVFHKLFSEEMAFGNKNIIETIETIETIYFAHPTS